MTADYHTSVGYRILGVHNHTISQAIWSYPLDDCGIVWVRHNSGKFTIGGNESDVSHLTDPVNIKPVYIHLYYRRMIIVKSETNNSYVNAIDRGIPNMRV